MSGSSTDDSLIPQTELTPTINGKSRRRSPRSRGLCIALPHEVTNGDIDMDTSTPPIQPERMLRRETIDTCDCSIHLSPDSALIPSTDGRSRSPTASALKRRQTCSVDLSDVKFKPRHSFALAAIGRQRTLSRTNSYHESNELPKLLEMKDLVEVGEVGQGSFGRVVKFRHKKSGKLLVVKEVLEHSTENEESVLREVSLLRSLGHPNVLQFVGVMVKDKCLCLVTEYIECGSLHRVIQDVDRSLPWTTRTGYAMDIAAGMAYLHENSIVHRDLNSPNCLVRTDDTIVVADFGLSKIIADHTQDNLGQGRGRNTPTSSSPKSGSRRKHTVVGNPYWMAPEMLAGSNYNQAVDVYSFGIILCELLARVDADPDSLPRDPRYLAVDLDHFAARMLNSDCPPPLVVLTRNCCSLKPQDRPDFNACLSWLESLHFSLNTGSAFPKDMTM